MEFTGISGVGRERLLAQVPRTALHDPGPFGVGRITDQRRKALSHHTSIPGGFELQHLAPFLVGCNVVVEQKVLDEAIERACA